MSEPITVRFRWTAKELIVAQAWHYRQRVRPLFRLALWIVITSFIVLGSLAVIHPVFSAPVWLLPLGLFLALLQTVIRPWQIRRQLAKSPHKDAQIEFQITDDSIRTQTIHGQSQFAWSALAKVVETPQGFLFYPTLQVFQWLPRHGFASDGDFERLAEIAQRRAITFQRAV